MKSTEPPIVVEQYFDIDLESLWSIITQKEHMVKWFFDCIPAFEAKEGFQTKFDIHTGERTFPHLWKVIKVERPDNIVYNWKYDGYAGDSNVHFELTDEGHCRILRVTAEVLEDFQEGIPEFNRESGVGGWNYFIKESLPRYVETLGQ